MSHFGSSLTFLIQNHGHFFQEVKRKKRRKFYCSQNRRGIVFEDGSSGTSQKCRDNFETTRLEAFQYWCFLILQFLRKFSRFLVPASYGRLLSCYFAIFKPFFGKYFGNFWRFLALFSTICQIFSAFSEQFLGNLSTIFLRFQDLFWTISWFFIFPDLF